MSLSVCVIFVHVCCRNCMFLSYPDKRLCLFSAWQKRSSSSPGFPSCYCTAGSGCNLCSDKGIGTAHCCNPSFFTTSGSAHNKGAAFLDSPSSSLPVNLFPGVKSTMVITIKSRKSSQEPGMKSSMTKKKKNHCNSNKNQ